MARRASGRYISRMSDQTFLSGLRAALRGLVKMIDGYLCVHPEPPIRVVARAADFRVNDFPSHTPEDPMTNIIDLSMPALSFNGVLPVKFFRGAEEVHPNASRVKVASSDESVITASYSNDTPDGQVVTFVPHDAAVEGSTATVTVSADETGTDDDLVVNFTIGPFKITSTTADVSQFKINDTDPNAPV